MMYPASSGPLPPLRPANCAPVRVPAGSLPVSVLARSMRAEAAGRCNLGCEEAQSRGQLCTWRRADVVGRAGALKRPAPLPTGAAAAAVATARGWVSAVASHSASGGERRRRDAGKVEERARAAVHANEREQRWTLSRGFWLVASQKARAAAVGAAAADRQHRPDELATRESEMARRRLGAAKRAMQAEARVVGDGEQSARLRIVAEEQHAATRLSLAVLRLEALHTLGDVGGTTLGAEGEERTSRSAVVEVERSVRMGMHDLAAPSRAKAAAAAEERLKREATDRARVWCAESDARPKIAASEREEMGSVAAAWDRGSRDVTRLLVWRCEKEEAAARLSVEFWESEDVLVMGSEGAGAAVNRDARERTAGKDPAELLRSAEAGYRRLAAADEASSRAALWGGRIRVEVAAEAAARRAVDEEGMVGFAHIHRSAATLPGTPSTAGDDPWLCLDRNLGSRRSTRSVESVDAGAEIAAHREGLLRRYYCFPSYRQVAAARKVQAAFRGYRVWSWFLRVRYEAQLKAISKRRATRAAEASPRQRPRPDTPVTPVTPGTPSSVGGDPWAVLDTLRRIPM
eukprot:TRINITY_DN8741_c0_g1_i1.p1 TRINITY_DN8741_c0_g1~~TRINITY_DN8741_c0_g1_i1.p1  ORF type:complete len:575 (+),score=152.97 TRINITY_DN8741_c0_g1_i1:68-1792(+)